MNSFSIEQRINEVERHAKEDDPNAVIEATELVRQFPHDARVWSLRAYVVGRAGDLAAAISDLTRALEVGSPEPSLLFDRGRYRLKLGQVAAAIDDFGTAIDFCEKTGDKYYSETLHFFRADALIRVGRCVEAMEDLRKVRDDFALWTTELRSKEFLVNECSRN